MNDKGKGKVAAVAATPLTSATPNAFSSMAALSKQLEAISKGKGKSKEQEESLPGRFPSVFPPRVLN